MIDSDIDSSLLSARAQVAKAVKENTNTLKALNEVIKAMRDPVKNGIALGEAVAAFQKSGGGILAPEVFESLTGLLADNAKQVLDDLSFTFARDLRLMLEVQGIPVSGANDRFIVEPFLIDVNKQQRNVNIKFGHEVLNSKPIGLDPERVVKALTSVRKSVTDREADVAELLKQLFTSCNRILASTRVPFGARVNVVECYRDVVWLRQSESFKRRPSKAAFADYPRAYFTYDVLQLRRRNLLKYESHSLHFGVATIDATNDEARSMWMPDSAEDGRYIMDLYWTKEA